jgi:hypothetical protein
MAFDLEAELVSHDGVRPTRYEPSKCRPDHSALRLFEAGLDFTRLCCACARRNENALLGKCIMVSNLFNQVTTETTHCAYADYTGTPPVKTSHQ